MSIFDGLSRPMRATGLGLVAVAVVAALVGGITLLTGSGDSDEAAAPNPSSAPQSPTGDSDGTSGPDASDEAPSSDTSEQPSAPGSATSQPGDDTPAPGGNGDNGQDGDGDGTDDSTGNGQTGENQQAGAQQSVGVRVYNNSNVKGLATDAADDFRAQGWNVVEVSNYPSGIIPTSTAYFRPGTQEEAAARVIGQAFGLRVEPRFDGIKDSSGGVIVIVTMDYEGAGKGK
ncbi:LytR C-terminal domain-containing protein [Prauserella cavernicola]|uniref:LytR C-terminal domain-containing protein n=1 Tax=Prauserella cavernicola TaxID=2800127 RepID=A0A934V4E6_9PSEU|nr:LytR C-terminal domain-containing protein [Prauserella cavernicola]MBK1785337.1 LytR C-terminal domain-containing protein [Prauserella cavernicola]